MYSCQVTVIYHLGEQKQTVLTPSAWSLTRKISNYMSLSKATPQLVWTLNYTVDAMMF